MLKSDQYSPAEKKILGRLSTPGKIQDFINSLRFNFEEKGETCMSPRRVLSEGKAHCMEGAMFAAAALEYHGYKPLVLDLRSVKPHDDDHVVAVFRKFGCYGAISKTNHCVLRYREPVYKTIRELVLSYFHEYFLQDGRKTLREYSNPINLNRFNNIEWRTSDKELFQIPKAIDAMPHFKLLGPSQIAGLRRADDIEIKSGEIVEWTKIKGSKPSSV